MSICYDVITLDYERDTKESEKFCRWLETYNGGYYNLYELKNFVMIGWGLFCHLYRGYKMDVSSEFTWYIKYEDEIVRELIFKPHLD